MAFNRLSRKSVTSRDKELRTTDITILSGSSSSLCRWDQCLLCITARETLVKQESLQNQASAPWRNIEKSWWLATQGIWVLACPEGDKMV